MKLNKKLKKNDEKKIKIMKLNKKWWKKNKKNKKK